MAGCTTVGSTLPPTARSIDTGRALPAFGVVASPTPVPKHVSTGRALPAGPVVTSDGQVRPDPGAGI